MRLLPRPKTDLTTTRISLMCFASAARVLGRKWGGRRKEKPAFGLGKEAVADAALHEGRGRGLQTKHYALGWDCPAVLAQLRRQRKLKRGTREARGALKKWAPGAVGRRELLLGRPLIR